MTQSKSDVPSSPHDALDPLLFAPIQGFVGLVLGILTTVMLIEADPFGVVSFRLPEGADGAQAIAAFLRWKSSPRVIIGDFTMTLVPLLVSGACGVWVYTSRPASVPVALLRMSGVVFLLALVSWFGSSAIERALSTGESSDLQTPFAMLAFSALCIALAAPLSSVVTPRRSPARGPDASKQV